MKRLIVIFAMAIVGMAAHAQNMTEVVYLKNGSIIKGTIIEQVPNESLKIQTADGSIFVYNISEVQKITKETVKPTYSRTPSAIDDDEEEEDARSGSDHKGFFCFFELGELFGNANSPQFNVAFGGRFNPHFFLGGGVGTRYYFNGDIEGFALPIFANVRIDILDRKVSPILDFKGGYSPVDIQGGFFSAAIGCRIRMGDGKFALTLSTGYEMQQYDYGHYYNSTETAHEGFFRVGVEF